MPAFSYLEFVLLALLLTASGYDVAIRKIPNRLLAVGLAAALVLHLTTHPLSALLTMYLAGFAAGLLLLLPLYLFRAMAAGDVKLMATVGAFTGPELALHIGLATYCAGGLLALLMVVFMGRARQAFTNMRAVLRPYFMRLIGCQLAIEPMPFPSVGGMPYAVAITAGTVAVFWLRYA